MMKKSFFILFLFACFAFQTNDYTLVKTISSSASFITTDNLGNLYMIVNNELGMYDSNGNLLKTFSDKTHGSIDFVDVSNPLQILLFYRDFRQVVFLDNMLSKKSDALLLDGLQILQPQLACSSYENGFWIYDQQDFQLIRFDINLQRSNQSGNIAQLAGIEIKPNFLTEIGGNIYMNDPENGILIFDKYGTFAKILPIKNLTSFQVIENNIIFSTGISLVKYNIKTFEQQYMTLPEKNVKCAKIEKEKLFVQDSTSVKIYTRN